MFMVASNTARERNQAPDDAPFLGEALGVVALGKRTFSVSGVIVEALPPASCVTPRFVDMTGDSESVVGHSEKARFEFVP